MANIYEHIERRILILDGGMGTMVQSFEPTEETYRGERFASHPVPLKGCNDLLAVTAPQIVGAIHEAYLEAGADIISTDSFNANAISLADYGLGEMAYEIARAAAVTARAAADKYTAADPSKPRFVAGSVGPTNRTSSMSADVNNPAAREVTFAGLAQAYGDQIRGLLDGGADIILIETVFDTLNAKAALFAAESIAAERGVKIPLMVSGTLADASGRTLSGQTVEAFCTSVSHAGLLAVGLNCAYGASQMRPYLERLAAVAECPVSAHPNAGLPNVMGGYDETPQMFADDVEEYMKEGLVNIVGGCCGTTPEHIRLVAQRAALYAPRPLPEPRRRTVLSGLEPLQIAPESNFVNVGERTNVAGSARFARLIREGDYEEALSVARAQVEAGAQIIDICMDDGLIDGPQAMRQFLNLAASEPEISRVPFMIDSSRWEVLEAGLQCVQGKSVVNSISLKEGEEEFLRRAGLIRRYGAAAVVMLFDERGQADTFDRKMEVARRAYALLTGAGFPAEDIIFDPNILSVATGIREHDNYGRDFIEACRNIKREMPLCKVSGGVSNLSFAFRGNNPVREAMHSVFLYHAVEAGMDMGIVNPAMLQIYSDIEPELLGLCEDVVLNRRPDATDRLARYAEQLKAPAAGGEVRTDAWRSEPLAGRIRHAMIKGMTDFIESDTEEAYAAAGSPLAVIDRYLMPAMEEVGRLFGEGKMFLPQVVKSARVMKRAVGVLTPYMERSGEQAAATGTAGKVLLATVKGDVHDIGKNIVSVVLQCNGYEVCDMGVMAECGDIVDEAVAQGVQAIGLSGLITPSLEEMIKVVRELERRGLDIPVVIGGATTSPMHTAVKIAPEYRGTVVHSRDASENARLVSRLLGDGAQEFREEVARSQQQLREEYARSQGRKPLLSLAQARADRRVKRADEVVEPCYTRRMVFYDLPIEAVEPYMDWNFFFPAWGLKGRWPEILSSPDKGAEAQKLYDDARAMLARMKDTKEGVKLYGVCQIVSARSEGDDIVVSAQGGREWRLPMLRCQEAGEGPSLSLADYVTEDGRDHVCLFAVTAGGGLGEFCGKLRSEGDDYSAIMAKLLADRLAEAFTEYLHRGVRRELWGFETGEDLSPGDIIAGKYQGLRMAMGYPASPDHSLKREIFSILGVEMHTPMRLTENYMIDPGESLCGMIFADRALRYFSVGRIGADQIEDYARRRGMEPAEVEKIIAQHL